MKYPTETIAQSLDAAVLKPEFSVKEVEEAILGLIPFKVKTVCVRSSDVPLARRLLRHTGIGVSCVVGFPHGCHPAPVKMAEASWVLDAGTDEIDMVANYGYVRSGLWVEVTDEIRQIADLCHQHGKILKVIFETSMLEEPEILKLVDCCLEAGADFIKTSTGFNGSGAQPEVVEKMIHRAAGKCETKPSGGIRDRQSAERYLTMGATRLGVNYSSVATILSETPGLSSTPSGNY
jgi:deoxyribose-phosphate aldolase